MNDENNKSWDDVISKLDGSFLQSSSWAAFQVAAGAPVHRLSGDNWACLLIEQKSRLRQYLFAPYGPVLANPQALSEALKAISVFGRKHGFHWVRLEPSLALSKNTELGGQTQANLPRCMAAHKQVDPLYTRILDLSLPEKDLFASLSTTNRRTIRRHNDRPALSFRTSRDPNEISLFIEMMRTVSRRNQVFFHSDEHFIKEAEILMPRGEMRIEFAELNGKAIACIVMHDFNNVTNYTYAASLPEARKLDASALLLWNTMLNAKSNGFTRLDLFGVVPDDSDPSHPWSGFSAFKRKFGGTIIKRGSTIDIPLSARYYAYRAALKIKK